MRRARLVWRVAALTAAWAWCTIFLPVLLLLADRWFMVSENYGWVGVMMLLRYAAPVAVLPLIFLLRRAPSKKPVSTASPISPPVSAPSQPRDCELSIRVDKWLSDPMWWREFVEAHRNTVAHKAPE